MRPLKYLIFIVDDSSIKASIPRSPPADDTEVEYFEVVRQSIGQIGCRVEFAAGKISALMTGFNLVIGCTDVGRAGLFMKRAVAPGRSAPLTGNFICRNAVLDKI